jgi:hypothetical protein
MYKAPLGVDDVEIQICAPVPTPGKVNLNVFGVTAPISKVNAEGDPSITVLVGLEGLTASGLTVTKSEVYDPVHEGESLIGITVTARDLIRISE